MVASSRGRSSARLLMSLLSRLGEDPGCNRCSRSKHVQVCEYSTVQVQGFGKVVRACGILAERKGTVFTRWSIGRLRAISFFSERLPSDSVAAKCFMAMSWTLQDESSDSDNGDALLGLPVSDDSSHVPSRSVVAAISAMNLMACLCHPSPPLGEGGFQRLENSFPEVSSIFGKVW